MCVFFLSLFALVHISLVYANQETRSHIDSEIQEFHLRKCLIGYVHKMEEGKHQWREMKEYFPDVSESLVQLLEYQKFSKVKRPIFIEIGLGTTATRGLTTDWANANVTTMHYHTCFGPRCKECYHDAQRWKAYEFSNSFPALYEFLFEIMSFGCFDAFADTPIPHLLPHVFRIAPNARYVYTTRNPEEWWNSRHHHIGIDILYDMHKVKSLTEVIGTRRKINPKDGVLFYEAYDSFVRCILAHTPYLELNYFENEAIFHDRDGSTKKLIGSASENAMKYAIETHLWEGSK
jgi:hypothetical protein